MFFHIPDHPILLMIFDRKYLSDEADDVRMATENLLADFLREIRDVTAVQRRNEEQLKARREAAEQLRRTESEREKSSESAPVNGDRGIFLPEKRPRRV